MYTLLKFIKRYGGSTQVFSAFIIMWAGQTFALDSFDTLQIHGFINQGYFLTTDNNLYGKSSSNQGSLALTEIGVNGSIRPLSNLGLAAQGVYRRAGEISDEARIDYALIDWTIADHENYRYGIRLGRVKTPLGFFNDTRDVAFTRPSITLPSLYQERARDLFLGSDGGQFYLNMDSSIGDFSLHINGGKLKDNPKELEISILGADRPGELKSKTSYMGKLGYENKSGSTRFAVSYADVEMFYEPGAADFLSKGNLSFEFLLFSLQQHMGDLTLTGEYLRIHNSITNFGIHFPDFKPTSESYYLQVNYSLSSQLQAIIRYDVAYNNTDDRNGDFYATLTSDPNYSAYSKDQMVGLRWAPKSNWLIQAEYHRIDGVSELSAADNPDLSAAKQHWNLFALQLSYRF